ncbi:MAG: hypothetical protein AAFV93_19250 [Chloroflexota bacterium]
MPQFPDKLIQIATTGSNPRSQSVLANEGLSLIHDDTAPSQPERDLLLAIAGHSLQQRRR